MQEVPTKPTPTAGPQPYRCQPRWKPTPRNPPWNPPWKPPKPPIRMPCASAGEAERAKPTVSAATDAAIEVLSEANIGYSPKLGRAEWPGWILRSTCEDRIRLMTVSRADEEEGSSSSPKILAGRFAQRLREPGEPFRVFAQPTGQGPCPRRRESRTPS